jgi:hypothetical protein
MATQPSSTKLPQKTLSGFFAKNQPPTNDIIKEEDKRLRQKQ